jgi:superfamily II DNA helicase RecQ
VLLTATLPPLLEHELSEAILIPLATYIRASTVRVNTRYSVQWCAPGKAKETALAVYGRQGARLDGIKGVVYYRTKAQCEDVARKLDCPYYHAGVVDREERLKRWLKRGGFIVATSALGTGVDFLGIVFVLHVGLPYGIINYAQKTGRAGRSKEAVDLVVLLEDGEVERRAKTEAVSVNKSAIAAFIITTEYRRGVISAYLDGKEATCADIDCAACDKYGEGLVDWRSSQGRDTEEQQQVRRLLNELADGCPVY